MSIAMLKVEIIVQNYDDEIVLISTLYTPRTEFQDYDQSGLIEFPVAERKFHHIREAGLSISVTIEQVEETK